MTAFEHKIKQLISLTRHSSGVNRELVYRKLATLLLDQRVESDEDELSALLRLFDALTPAVGIECRIEIARLIASHENPPMALAEHVATDLASVAAPILKKAHFDEETLLRIISATGRAHHLLIAERADLTDRTWNALSSRPKPDNSGERPIPVEPTPAPVVTSRQPEAFQTDQVAPLTRDPSRDLAALAAMASGPKESEFLLEDPAEGFRWMTNRQGRITGLSPHAHAAFGRTAESLKGLFFFSLVEPLSIGADGHKFDVVLTRHLPIRDLPIEIEDNQGKPSRWLLRGKAGFDASTGRFTGYRGRVLDEGRTDQEQDSAAREQASPETMMSQRVAQDARLPIAASLAAAMRLRKRIGALGDSDLMSDLTEFMDGCYGIRDLIEDMENTLAVNRRLLQSPTQRFGLAGLVKECLRENILRRGGVSWLRLEGEAEDIPAFFDRRLAYQAVIRMLKVSGAHTDMMRDDMITITRASNGKNEIRVPLGTAGGGILDEEILFSTTAFLRRAPSQAADNAALSLPPEFGLSAVKARLRANGGNIYLGRDPDGSRWLSLSLPSGR